MIRPAPSLPRCAWSAPALLAVLLFWGLVPALPAAPLSAPTAEETEKYLNITGVVPPGGQSVSDSVTIIFEAPIRTPEKDQAPPSPYQAGVIRFEGAGSGEGQVTVGPNFILWRPQQKNWQGLFNAILNPDLTSIDGKPLNPRHRVIVLSTTTFQPAILHLLAQTEETITFGARFTLPLQSDVSDFLSVADGDGPREDFQTEVLPSRPEYLRITLDKPIAWPVTVTFRQGLPNRGGQMTLLSDHTLTCLEAPSLTLNVHDIRWQRLDHNAQTILLRFNHPVETEQLQRHLTIHAGASADDPAIAYTFAQGPSVEVAPLHIVQVRADMTSGLQLTVRLAEGLTSNNNARLTADYVQTLTHNLVALGVQRIQPQVDYQDAMRSQFLYLEMNRPISLEEMRAHLTLDPPVEDLRIERGWSSNNFNLYGRWRSNQTYRGRIEPGIRDQNGFVHSRTVTFNAQTRESEPALAFTHPGKYYFPQRDRTPLQMTTRNVDRVALDLYRVFPSNEAIAAQNIWEGGQPSWDFLDRYAEKLQQTTMETRSPSDDIATHDVDFASILPADRRGLFVIAATGSRANGQQLQTISRILLHSDMGLVSHWRNDELILFAHNLITLDPIPSARVTVYSSKYQVLAQAFTDERGVAHLRGFRESLGVPESVFVSTGEDWTFLQLSAREGWTHGGDSLFQRDGYDAFLYSDRNLYRPGETVHLRWMVRTNYGDAVSAVPFLLEVARPNGVTLVTSATVVSEWGSGGLSLETLNTYPTGRYQARLLIPGSRTVVGSMVFHLEDFVPNRIQVAVSMEDTTWKAGEEQRIEIQADHLFGAPAADRRAEAEIVFTPRTVKFDQWPDYTFSNDEQKAPERYACGEARTDESGKAVLTYTYEAPSEATMPLEAVVTARVYELGGRHVENRLSTIMVPSDISLGLRATAPDSDSIAVHVAAIGPDQSPADLDKVRVVLERSQWSYYMRWYHDRYSANLSETYETLLTEEVDLTDGRGQVVFKAPRRYENYRIRVVSDATPQFASLQFYQSWQGPRLTDTGDPSLLTVTLDKDFYEPGEEAHINIKSEFDGVATLVLQNERFQELIPVTITDGAGSARIRLDQAHAPNLWVQATAIHAIPLGEAPVHPFSSFAVANIVVRDPLRRLKVEIPGAPVEVRPDQEVRFQITTTDAAGRPTPAEVTVAAVDEGILQILNYQTPDPLAHITRIRRPDLRRAHYYDRIAYNFERTATGGDGIMDSLSGAYLATDDESWIQPVALWSGAVQTGADGKAEVVFHLPEFSGQLRVMAVAGSKQAMGSASHNVLVKRPHMLRTTLPRFLLPEDRCQARATLFNHTDEPCTVTLTWQGTGPIGLLADSVTTSLDAGGEWSVPIALEAGTIPGQAYLDWQAVFTDASGQIIETLRQRSPLPVRAPAAYQPHHVLRVLDGGTTMVVENTRFFDDERVKVEVTVGGHPITRLEKSLRYVVGYPYGCLEQIVARLLPMYLLRQAHATLARDMIPGQSLDHFIQVGIDRVLAMQTGTGGLGGWPGMQRDYPYGSIFGLHFLTLVEKDREFHLNRQAMEALRRHVWATVQASQRNNPQDSGDLYTRAYGLYVLALGGDLQAIEQIERFDGANLPTSARYLLAAALAIQTKDPERVAEYLNTTTSFDDESHTQSGALHSPIRNKAVQLLALMQIGQREQEAHQLAQELMDFISQRHWGNTQESAFIITALAQYFQQFQDLSLLVEGVIIDDAATTRVRGLDRVSASASGAGARLTIRNTGSAPIYVNSTVWGVPKTAETEAVSNRLKIARTYHTADGPLEPDAPFVQGKAYVVQLRLEAPMPVENVVVSDLLPAGFEIDNPRLNPMALEGYGFPHAHTPTFMEVRDDRMVLAWDEVQSEAIFYYVVRPVLPGFFVHPAITAECMYDGSIRAASTHGTVRIQPVQ